MLLWIWDNLSACSNVLIMNINTEMRSQCNHIDTGWHAIKLFDGSEARSSIISVRSVVHHQSYPSNWHIWHIYWREMASKWGRITGVFTDDSKNAYRSGFSWITNSFFDYTVQQKQLTDISKIVAVLSCRISIKSWQTVTKGKEAAVVRHGHKIFHWGVLSITLSACLAMCSYINRFLYHTRI